MIKIIFLAILIEALTELFFKAGPIQGFRRWIIKKTPFLEIEEQHLFDCKYCTSFWVGVFVVLMSFWENSTIRTAGIVIVVARLSNFVHIVYATVFNAKMNMILRRK